MALFYPNLYYSSVFCIDYEQLYAKGIRVLLFDVDNTLEVYTTFLPGNAVMELFARLKQMGFSMMLISNGREQRVRLYAAILDVDYIFRAGKPKPGAFREAMKALGAEPKECAVIGDQIFTDVLGGNLSGACSILTEPISRKIDESITRIKRPAEKLLMHFYLRKHRMLGEKK